MREKPESVDFPNAASQGAKIGSISQPSPTGNPATIGCVYSCTGAFSFALYDSPVSHHNIYASPSSTQLSTVCAAMKAPICSREAAYGLNRAVSIMHSIQNQILF